MPTNSAKGKLRRAMRHLIAARVLVGSLPTRFWEEVENQNAIDAVTETLTDTQRKIKAIKDPISKSPEKVSDMAK